MKTKVYLFATLCFFLLGTAINSIQAQTENIAWKIDATHSTISFTVRHYFAPFQGAFNKFEGTFNFNEKNPSAGSAELTIEVASIDTKNERRDNHLKSADFFDAENHPMITFKSKKIVAGEDNQFTVVGDFTMRGTTKEIEIPAIFLGSKEHPRNKENKIGGAKGEVTINRTDYGVGAGNFAATTTIGDEVTISLFLELSYRPEK